MHEVGLIGDLHLGHAAIARVRGFENADEYNEYVIKQYNSVMGKKSMGIIVGDITMETAKYYHLLDRLNGRKIVVGGNHDMKKDIIELLKHVEAIVGVWEYKKCIITHIPIHSSEVGRFLLNIHGHLHGKLIHRLDYQPLIVKVSDTVDKRYRNVSWDQLDGIPISFKQIISEI